MTQCISASASRCRGSRPTSEREGDAARQEPRAVVPSCCALAPPPGNAQRATIAPRVRGGSPQPTAHSRASKGCQVSCCFDSSNAAAGVILVRGEPCRLTAALCAAGGIALGRLKEERKQVSLSVSRLPPSFRPPLRHRGHLDSLAVLEARRGTG